VAKLRRYPEENRAYLVTAVVKDRSPIFGDERIARSLRDIIDSYRERYGFLVLAYVIMPDHIHAVLVPGKKNTVSDVMRYVKGSFARWYNQTADRRGAVWQPRFYDTAIRSEQELAAKIEYIEANPVRARIVEDAAAYAFSSAARGWRGDLEQYYDG
jgi:putative transposase